ALAAERTAAAHGSVGVDRCTGDRGAPQIDDGPVDVNRITVAAHRQVETRRHWIGGERTKGLLRNERRRIAWGHLHDEARIEANRGRESDVLSRSYRHPLRKRSQMNCVQKRLGIELAWPGALEKKIHWRPQRTEREIYGGDLS